MSLLNLWSPVFSDKPKLATSSTYSDRIHLGLRSGTPGFRPDTDPVVTFLAHPGDNEGLFMITSDELKCMCTPARFKGPVCPFRNVLRSARNSFFSCE